MLVTVCCVARGSETVSLEAGVLRLQVEERGLVTALVDIRTGMNYIAPAEHPCWLVECHTYGEGTHTVLKQPASLEVVSKTDAAARIALKCDDDTTLAVLITANTDYFTLELVDAKPVADISHITWGPLRTTMRGPIAEWLGLNRSDDFTIGLMSLEPNTDGVNGPMSFAASYQPAHGASMELWSFDHTREREYAKHRFSSPIPSVTVIGSRAALFGTKRGRDAELDIIEKIELGEGLPHPMYRAKWAKRSLEVQKPCLWTGMRESNADDCIEVAKALGAGTVCNSHGFFRNWGHFEVDPKMYPGGMASVRTCSEKASRAGVDTTVYALTGFLKPISAPEPFITPAPDDRLQTWRPGSSLVESVSASSENLKLADEEGLHEVFGHPFRMIRIGTELIRFNEFDVQESTLVIRGAERGYFHTSAVKHEEGSPVICMYMSGYENLYPGTVEMNNEMAGYIADAAEQSACGKVILDGYESCIETGHGTYAKTMFLKTIYDRLEGKDVLYSASNQDNYDWHINSYQSWGEWELHKGFRGSMLDYRLMRQVQLRRNLMPNKMGQYYPSRSRATIEDINWLMALAVGWESGVDLSIDAKRLKRRSEYEAICETIRMWEEARLGGIFTDEEKTELRQTDMIHRLVRKPDGRLGLEFVKYWRHDDVKILPASFFEIEPIVGGESSLDECSIEWSWTHNPAIYEEVGLSQDLVHRTGKEQTKWKVVYPVGPRGKYSGEYQPLMVVLRLPEDAPCGVRNPEVVLNGTKLEFPVTLEPGQYVTTSHDMGIGWVYNGEHKIIAEVDLPNVRASLPSVKKGTPTEIGASCEAVDSAKVPEIRLNLAVTHHIVDPKYR